MNTLTKFLALLCCAVLLCSCTNDEGETEFDIVDPGTDQQQTAWEQE